MTGGRHLLVISLGKFTYDPWWASLWREKKSAVIGGLTTLALLSLYAGYFAGMLMIAPARLALVGGVPGLDSVIKPGGNVAFFGISRAELSKASHCRGCAATHGFGVRGPRYIATATRNSRT
jgi:hypothetical protein